MALAFCIRYIEENNLARLTNYSEYMSLTETEYEVEIHENTSWSCYHGVERWKSNCGCNSGGHSEWNQNWRGPLRDSLDWLRDHLAEIYEKELRPFNLDPWKLRNEYIQVVLDRSEGNVKSFLDGHVGTSLSDQERTKVIRMLEMQRQAMLMYTSCAWFFDEVSGIETVQVMQYADRAVQLAERESNARIQEKFLKKLEKSKSNVGKHQNAAEIYKKWIGPKRLSLTKVGMHYAVASLFAKKPESLDILNYQCISNYYERHFAGIQRLAIGRTDISSHITLSQKQFSFAVIYLGQHHIIGSASDHLPESDFKEMAHKVKNAFSQSNISEVLDIMKHYFQDRNFSFFEMFRDAQIKVLDQIMESSVRQAAGSYKKIYDRNYNLLNVMQSADLHIPPMLTRNIGVVVNHELQEVFKDGSIDIEKLKNLTHQVKKWEVKLEKEILGFVATNKLNQIIAEYEKEPTNDSLLRTISKSLLYLEDLQVVPRLNELQNVVFKISRKLFTTWDKNPEQYAKVRQAFLQLAEELNLELEQEKQTIKIH